jgi:hypothetical protein
MIGKVVHFSEQTDSINFEFLPEDMVDLHKVRIGPNTKHDLLPALTQLSSLPHRIDAGTKICCFGAQRRGTAGIVKYRFNRNDHEVLLQNDIGIDSFGPNGDGKKMIRPDGDCGMITWTNRGIPWLYIMRSLVSVMMKVLQTTSTDHGECHLSLSMQPTINTLASMFRPRRLNTK